MLKHPPKYDYNGLSIILSNQSRFDKHELLSSSGGFYLWDKCFKPYGIRRENCDIRLKEDTNNLLPNTKAVLLLGEDALHSWIPESKINTIGELRGTPLVVGNKVCAISSFLPQECIDIQDWEGKLNPILQNTNSESSTDADKVTALSEKRRHGKTSGKNKAFWLRQDCKRISILLENNGHIPQEPTPNYKIYPAAEELITVLTQTKNEHFFFDCETDAKLNFTCFSFSFGLHLPIYVVPVVRHNYTWAYDRLPEIFRALAVAVRDNITVAHNGACFDFFVLAFKYRIALGLKSYDSMVAFHRCFPEVEKSLGHCTSILTWQPFHKDEGNFAYGNETQARQLWEYCGKDTFVLMLIKQSIDKYSKTVPGLEDSINQAMSSIRPYLITTLQGVSYDEDLRKKTVNENDRLAMQYIRMTELLIGKEFIKKIKATSKNTMLNSNNQCVRYFHDMLGYPIVSTSKKTGKPSLNKTNLFKLKLKVNNPVIDIAIAYREVIKETGAINFNPWVL